jgi:hypothetical protein
LAAPAKFKLRHFNSTFMTIRECNIHDKANGYLHVLSNRYIRSCNRPASEAAARGDSSRFCGSDKPRQPADRRASGVIRHRSNRREAALISQAAK